jgi:hypothetical protein
LNSRLYLRYRNTDQIEFYHPTREDFIQRFDAALYALKNRRPYLPHEVIEEILYQAFKSEIVCSRQTFGEICEEKVEKIVDDRNQLLTCFVHKTVLLYLRHHGSNCIQNAGLVEEMILENLNHYLLANNSEENHLAHLNSLDEKMLWLYAIIHTIKTNHPERFDNTNLFDTIAKKPIDIIIPVAKAIKEKEAIKVSRAFESRFNKTTFLFFEPTSQSQKDSPLSGSKRNYHQLNG